MGIVRKVRLNAKVLWLAFQVWRHNRQVRSFKARVETYAAAHQGEMSDLLLKRLKWVQEQNALLQVRAKEFQQRASSSL